MAGVARVARAERAVRVDAADAGVRPAPAGELVGARAVDLDLRAVAALAAQDGHRVAGRDVRQVGVGRVEDLAGGGVVRAADLLRFLAVAAAAVLGRHQRGDNRVVVLEGVDLAPLGLVAAQAGDVVPGVLGVVPLLVQPRRLFLVAGHAGARCLGILRRGCGSRDEQGDDEECQRAVHASHLLRGFTSDRRPSGRRWPARRRGARGRTLRGRRFSGGGSGSSPCRQRACGAVRRRHRHAARAP